MSRQLMRTAASEKTQRRWKEDAQRFATMRLMLGRKAWLKPQTKPLAPSEGPRMRKLADDYAALEPSDPFLGDRTFRHLMGGLIDPNYLRRKVMAARRIRRQQKAG